MQFGTPCWIDLATTDPKASRDFYGGLFGWQYQANRTGDYLTALADNVPAAGLYRVPVLEEAPSWTLYFAISDSKRTAERIVRLGGQVLMPPQDFEGQGSLLVAADPTGATIGFWQAATPWPFATGTKGELRWAELNTWDGDLADKFFVDLFGYQLEQIGDGQDFDYTTWSVLGATEPVAGRMQFAPDFPADTKPHWMTYFEVDPLQGTDEATVLAVKLGGRLLSEPVDSPFGRLSVVADPSGAVFTLVDSSNRSTPHAPSEEELGAPTDDPYDD